MKAAAISTLAQHLFETHGTKAITEAAQKAGSFEDAGYKEQAKFWRRVEAELLQMRGPTKS